MMDALLGVDSHSELLVSYENIAAFM